MSSNPVAIEKEAVVIGAGISGLVTAKCLLQDGFDVTILEKSTEIGGLWKFREDDYGVMSFTHINVSKYNYSFSDFPFPDDVPDYPHHTQMAQYINDYAKHFGVIDHIQFKISVDSVEQIGEKWRVIATKVEEDGKTQIPDSKVIIVCSYLAIATGHHAKPVYPTFRGQETFTGEAIHSVDYKDASMNKFLGKKVLVVGIGNSAVDVAVDCAIRCPSVYISTRSGAWIFSNYTFGHPTDLYGSRFFFMLPKSIQNFVLESMMKSILGSPRKWGLNPKMRILQTQPTVSPTLIHHLQRHNIKIAPNITKIDGNTVHFVNGKSSEFDKIVYCTGYKMDLPFLPQTLKQQMLNEDSNEIRLYKNVFCPSIGPSLAFIGFAQPASGGLLPISEIQGRWFSALCKGQVTLPSKTEMEDNIQEELAESKARWYKSGRHTIQRDPLLYSDEIASIIGAKPDFLSNPRLAWRLLFGSGGTFQFRLQGPHKWSGAVDAVMKTPVPEFSQYTGYLVLLIISFALYAIYRCMDGLFGI